MSIHRIVKKNRDKIVFLGGDFNLPNINWKDSVVLAGNEVKHHEKLLQIVSDSNLHQMQFNNTREESNLDLVFINYPDLITSCITAPGMSDHDLVVIDSKLTITHNTKSRRKIHIYKKANWEQIRYDINELSNKIVTMNESVETKWTALKDGITETMSKNIPTKLSSKKYNLPWISFSLQKKIQRKNRLYLIAKKTKSEETMNTYKLFKSEVQREIRNAHLAYINGTLSTGLKNGNNKAFWKYIKSKRQDNFGVASLKDNNVLYHESKEKADILNKQFHSVFTKANTNEPLPKLTEPAYPPIGKLKVTIDGILECASELAPAITSVFQLSIDTGALPSDWRRANVVPIFKKGSRCEPSNYRPVSLTSVCCKLLEHIICRYMRNHLEEHDILSPLQHGFRRRHSCETQLVITVDDITKEYDKGHQVDMCILDFSKAFDTVPHDKLLHKLDNYGIRGDLYKWIASFLMSRTQNVVVDGETSIPCKVESGVPQGTVLGPLLFLCHINDLPQRVKSQIRLFADDCLIYRPVMSPTDQHILQSDLDSLKKWADEWGMKFNEIKCFTMSMHRKRTPYEFRYSLNNHILDQVKDNPYLGVQISDNLRWTNHIVRITNKANSTLGIMRRNLKHCPMVIKEMAYTALVRPILEYGCVVWDPYQQKDINSLETVQKGLQDLFMATMHRIAVCHK